MANGTSTNNFLSVLSFIKLIRPVNLFIIALTQFLVRYCIIMPAYHAEFESTKTFSEHLSIISFSLIVLATVLIAAGGNIINDVFDVNIDDMNKPGKNQIGKTISKKTATNLSYSFFFVGSIIGVALGVKFNLVSMGFLFPFSAATLYMYSSGFKRQLLIGNILIAILSALTILIVGLFEPHYFVSTSVWLRGTELSGNNLDAMYLDGWKIILFYSSFAFLLSLIRELIKDAEDLDGDERGQRKTFPVRFGIKGTKIFVSILIVFTASLLSYLLLKCFANNPGVSMITLIGTIAVPLAALVFLLYTAEEKKDFYYASMFTKVIMIAGVLTMLPFYYFFMR